MRKSKKNAFQNWKVVTQAEEAWRTMITMEYDESSSWKYQSPITTSSIGYSVTNTTIVTECSQSIPENVNITVKMNN